MVSGTRSRLRWLLCSGRVVVEENAIPAVDLAELAHEARTAVRTIVAECF